MSHIVYVLTIISIHNMYIYIYIERERDTLIIVNVLPPDRRGRRPVGTNMKSEPPTPTRPTNIYIYIYIYIYRERDIERFIYIYIYKHIHVYIYIYINIVSMFIITMNSTMTCIVSFIV